MRQSLVLHYFFITLHNLPVLFNQISLQNDKKVNTNHESQFVIQFIAL